ncbi:hypothetical protein JL09_g5931 [Pichia kudriavzevii]|uniref:Uncharacterized protein n=1 Tax=Pichia kudriavzevii TaxID=4909 RepID=A0A099NQY0_PICKU|nr:hypothetical protein JL09_g5931 [Pichia kudriavzevii]
MGQHSHKETVGDTVIDIN